MPPKKGINKKVPIKLAVSTADAEVFNNGEKEVAKELSDANILQNGASPNNAEVINESTKSKATKGGSGRSKNTTVELNTEAPPSKKPVAKGRGKAKVVENEVMESEVDNTKLEIQEDSEKDAVEVKKKSKAKDVGKKAEPKARKNTKAKENKKVSSSGEGLDVDTNKEEVNIKAVSSRKKGKQIVTTDQMDVKQETLKRSVEEKVSKKSLGNSEKMKELTPEIESQKKKGRTSKKDKVLETNESELMVGESGEGKSDKKEKKPVKRGRTAAKAAIATEDKISSNGDTDEVLPKKRSRKAPSSEKETVGEKPKRGRTKKADKVQEDIIKKEKELDGKEKDENVKNGQIKQNVSEYGEEFTSLNIKAENQDGSAAPLPVAATKSKSGRKRVAPSTNNKKPSKKNANNNEMVDNGIDNAAMEDDADGSKTSKAKKKRTDSTLLNPTATEYIKSDFDLLPPSDGQTVEEPRFNLKISSWNVAGLRSWLKKGGLKFIDYEHPDIFCMQETKCSNDQLPEEVSPIPGYHPYWLCMPGGYAGVAIYSKIMPINVEYGIGNKEFDDCGRIITAEYEKFFLINVYVPNSGRKLVNLEARMKWEKLFQQFVQNLDARKPVVICGDMNVSHQEIDLANPKTNTRSAGFTKEERDKMTELLALGYTDTFRHLYPDRKGAYTYWTYMANARSRNVGWRLDYFIVSERFMKRVVDNCIRSQCLGSDHCPITLFLKL